MNKAALAGARGRVPVSRFAGPKSNASGRTVAVVAALATVVGSPAPESRACAVVARARACARVHCVCARGSGCQAGGTSAWRDRVFFCGRPGLSQLRHHIPRRSRRFLGRPARTRRPPCTTGQVTRQAGRRMHSRRLTPPQPRTRRRSARLAPRQIHVVRRTLRARTGGRGAQQSSQAAISERPTTDGGDRAVPRSVVARGGCSPELKELH